MVHPPVPGLADVSLRYMQRVVGRTFHTDDHAGRRVPLKLVEVTDMRPHRRLPGDPGPSIVEREGTLVAISALGLSSESVPVGDRPIGLLFVGPARHPLHDDAYDLDPPWLHLPGVHLSPLGPSSSVHGEGVLYEAILG